MSKPKSNIVAMFDKTGKKVYLRIDNKLRYNRPSDLYPYVAQI